MLVTLNGYALRFNIEEVPVVGAKAAGVKAVNLKDGDLVQVAFVANTESMYLLTQRGSLKRMALEVIPVTSRAKRGLQVLRELKSKPHRVFVAGSIHTSNDSQSLDLFSTAELSDDTEVLQIMSTTGKVYEVILEELSLSERTSNFIFIYDII